MFDARGAVRKAVATKGEGRWEGREGGVWEIFLFWAYYIRHLAAKVLTALRKFFQKCFGIRRGQFQLKFKYIFFDITFIRGLILMRITEQYTGFGDVNDRYICSDCS